MLTALSITEFGENEFAARIPSTFAGILAIPAIFVFGKLLGGPVAGLWSALILAFPPSHLRVSQFSRHYALLMLFSLISSVLVYRALSKPKWSNLLAYAIVTALNLYPHFGAMLQQCL